jgi:hypothetical protein
VRRARLAGSPRDSQSLERVKGPVEPGDTLLSLSVACPCIARRPKDLVRLVNSAHPGDNSSERHDASSLCVVDCV